MPTFATALNHSGSGLIDEPEYFHKHRPAAFQTLTPSSTIDDKPESPVAELGKALAAASPPEYSSDSLCIAFNDPTLLPDISDTPYLTSEPTPTLPNSAFASTDSTRTTSAILSGRRAPLTRRNLRRHTRNMTSTPKKSPSKRGLDGPSKTPTSSGASSSVDMDLKFRNLKRHGLQVDTNDSHPFVQDVIAMVDGCRLSAMREASILKFKELYQKHKFKNERTLLYHLVPKLNKDSRTINLDATTDPSTEEASDSDDEDDESDVTENTERLNDSDTSPTKATKADRKAVRRAIKPFSDEHADRVVEQIFKSSCAPFLNGQFVGGSGWSTPVPDFCFGVDSEAFTPELGAINDCAEIANHAGIAKGIFWPFLALEGKSCQRTLLEAKLQACRDGGALVYNRLCVRRFSEGIPNDDPRLDTGLQEGIDKKSIAFSLVIVADGISELFLHWYEYKDSREAIHMTTLFTYVLRKDNDLKDLRRHFNNVMEWGLIDNMTEVKRVLAEVSQRLKN